MRSYFTILRPANALMAALAVFVGGIIPLQLGALSSVSLGLAVLAAFLIIGAGNVVNDYVDVEADKINRPKRPIPSGRISPRVALGYAICLFIIGIGIARFVNLVAFLIAIINSLLLIGYAFSLKSRALIGHVVVSYLVGSTFLFGGAAVGQLKATAVLFLLAALANFSRELVKALEDFEGDRAHFLQQMVSKIEQIASRFRVKEGKVELAYGKKGHLTLATLSLLLAIAISPVPFLLHIMGWPYLLVVGMADATFASAILSFLKASKPKQYGKASKFIKYGMFLGLLAFLVGAVV